MTDIRWGILGCGSVTEIKSGPALSETENSTLVAVMRRDAAKAEDYAARHGVGRWHSNVDDLLGDEAINAVYVATPPSSHAELAIRALEAGHNVLCEKPMAMNVVECQAMLDAAAATGGKLAVAYYRRALPRFERLRALLSEGIIGPVRCVEVRQFRQPSPPNPNDWRNDASVGGGGKFVDVQTHAIDWLDHVFGAPVHAAGVASGEPVEDTVSYTLGYSGGVTVSGLVCHVSPRNAEFATFYGEKGEITMSLLGLSPICLSIGGETREIEIADPAHVHGPLIEQVVDWFCGGPEPASTGESALRTTATIDEILRSHREARRQHRAPNCS